MEFCAHCMINILQNISQNRGNKKITFNDVRYAVSGAYLSMYPGKSMHSLSTSKYIHTFGHFPHGHLYYIKGLADGKADVIWCTQFHPSYTTTPSALYVYVNNTQHSASTVKLVKNVQPSAIYPGLTIKPNEIKMILECYSYFTGACYFPDGRNNVSAREAFGFLILNPKGHGSGGYSYFNSVVIFTPKPGLFNETPPT
jgi:hypothetical protein